MAPPRRIVRQQLEILIDFLEENKYMSTGLSPGAPVSHQKTKHKWSLLSKELNRIKSGALKTPDGWKKYWFEWRHKCRKRGANARRIQSGSEECSKRFKPLNDLEVRVLELCGRGSVAASDSTSSKLDNFLDSESDSETLVNLKEQSTPQSEKTRQSVTSAPRSPIYLDDESRCGTPPPKWAIRFEERRIAAEERMADALSSMATTMRTQEERRKLLEERIADALAAIARTVQDINSGVQEAVLQFNPLQANRTTELRGDVFYTH